MQGEVTIMLKDFFEKSLEEQGKGIELPFIGFMGLEDILTEDFGFNHPEHDGDNTNGWEVDFWYYFDKPGVEGTYCVSGSLGYGGFKFSHNRD